MKAKIQGLDKLFKNPVSYRIPQFQRPYEWSEEQWEPLWEDVRKIADHILKHGQENLLPLFMGSIILQPRKSTDAKVSQILVVDGQQRLTTLQLLLKATQNAFQESLSNTRKFKNLDKLLLNDQERTGNDPYNETKIRQSNRLDQYIFQAVIKDKIELEHQFHDITRSYNYFHENVREWVSRHADVDVRAAALYDALVKRLEVVSIILDTGEKPHFIYAILNSRGEPLTQADLIKATIMYEADVVDDEKKAKQLFGMFEDIWWHCVVERGRERHIRLDGFLNYWIIMRVSKYVKIPRTAAEFSNYIDGLKPNINIEKVAEDINEAGKVYRKIEKKKIAEIKLFLERVIETMEIGVIIPPLLWLYTNDIPEKERKRSVRALESYLVRRMLCKMGVMGLNIIFIEMVKLLKKQKDQPVDDVIIQFLKKKFGGNLWPDDFSVISYLTKNPMPGNAARKKMIFEAIETRLIIEKMKKRLKEQKSQPGRDVIQFLEENIEMLGDTSKLTVEPILPKNWANGDWPFPKDTVDETTSAVDRNVCIKFIGNLTLASKELNSPKSNKSWEDKKKALQKYSSLYLNKELLDNASEVWDETVIEKRSKQLAQAIVQIWPHAADI